MDLIKELNYDLEDQIGSYYSILGLYKMNHASIQDYFSALTEMAQIIRKRFSTILRGKNLQEDVVYFSTIDDATIEEIYDLADEFNRFVQITNTNIKTYINNANEYEDIMLTVDTKKIKHNLKSIFSHKEADRFYY